MAKHKDGDTQMTTEAANVEYPDRVSGARQRQQRLERESAKIADKAQVNEPAHKIGEVIPREDGSIASGRLGGVNANVEPDAPARAPNDEEILRAKSNDAEAGR